MDGDSNQSVILISRAEDQKTFTLIKAILMPQILATVADAAGYEFSSAR